LDGSVLYAEVNSGLVGWPGEDANEILVVRDITERRLREEEREEQLRMEEALASITSLFVDPKDTYITIGKTLEELSAFLGGKRSYFVEFGPDSDTIGRALEWSPGTDRSFSERLLKADARLFIDTFSAMSEGNALVLEDARELSSEIEKEFQEAYAIESVAVVPVYIRGTLRAALGCTSTERLRWAEHDVNLLKEIASTISRALERKEYVDELGKSEKFRARITESIGEGLFVVTNGVITWTNPQVTDLYGYAPGELTGKTVEVLLPDPGGLKEIREEMTKVLFTEGLYSAEDSVRHKDGSLFDVLFSVTSLGVSDEGAGQLLVAVKDVTEAKRMREEVEAAAEAYSTLFSSAGDALLVHARDGEILDANERALAYTGRSREELLGVNMRDLVPERLGELYQELAERVGRQAFMTFETRILRPDGSVLPAEATSRLTRIWGEEVVLSAMRDISERKKAEQDTKRRSLQLASLNEIVRASTSSLDLDTVLAEILRVTVEVGGADDGMVLLGSPDGRGTTVVTTDPDRYHPAMNQARERELLSWLVEDRRGAVLVDMQEQQDRAGFSLLKALKRGRPGQALVIPLYSGDKSIGAIILGTSHRRLFEERDFGFYNAAGAEIGVSIENALIYRELAAEHERLSLLYRSAQSISGELDLKSLLATTAAEAAKAIGSDSALIALVELDTEYFSWEASHNLDLGLLDQVRLPIGEGIGGEVVRRKRAVTLPARGHTAEGERLRIDTDPVVVATKIDWAAAVPLIAGDRVVGVMALSREQAGRELTGEDILLLEAIGRQAGVAIQNARLYQETRQHLEALEKAHQDLMVLDKMKSDFVSTVSHELRSPLAVIEGFAKTMSEHFDRIDRETQRESIEIILKKSIALEGLIENLLDMSRIERAVRHSRGLPPGERGPGEGGRAARSHRRRPDEPDHSDRRQGEDRGGAGQPPP
jgi:PAS domain S-box-containing protein